MTSSCIWRRLIAVAAVVALASCGDSAGDNNNETDSAVQTDAAVGDAALGDTATADDTSAPADTGTSDTSEGDTASPADTSTADTSTADTSTADTTTADTTDAGGNCPGGEGCPCAVDDDCDSKKCAEPDGGGDKVCQAPCKKTDPADEVCDGVDNDCDGKTDNDTCDDSNVCTTNACEKADDGSFGCVATPANGGTACDDGDACTNNDACLDGKCGGDKVDCDDSNPCTDDSCDATKGCVNTNNTATCDDGDACTEGEACADGKCAGGTSKNCDDANACTKDSCDATGGCANDNDDTAKCDDGDSCSENDSCSNGACSAGAQKDCDDKNPCTNDVCDSQTGKCDSKAIGDGGACDDGDACTDNDACSAGKCAGSQKSCDDSDPCTTDSCDAAKGCVNKSNAGGKCDDNNPCTENDACDAKGCTGTIKVCDDKSPCTTDSCDPTQGCVTKPVDGKCDDGDKCTSIDTCVNGSCSGSGAKDCDDSNPCTADGCDAQTGDCTHKAQQGKCDDGSKCTENDACVAGTCEGKKVSCEDNNPCTNDTCDAAAGCKNDNNNDKCDDNNACTSQDVCSGGKCSGTDVGAKKCDDSNPCTKDSCDPKSGCKNVNDNTAKCDDGDACTDKDVCKDGTCTAGANICQCKSNEDCKDDGNLCNGTPVCVSNKCVIDKTTIVVCDSSKDTDCLINTCVTDSGKCTLQAGNDGKLCKDGNPCTLGNTCAKGICKSGDKPKCDDGNACTKDACNVADGKCTNAVIDGCTPCKDASVCDDKNPCTKDACVAGQCASEPIAGCSIAPDLVAGKSFKLNATKYTTGATAVVSYSVSNIGLSPASARVDSVYLSTDKEFGKGDVEIGTVTAPSLGGKKLQSLSIKAKIPTTLKSGTYYLFVYVDSKNAVKENSEKNNQIAGPVSVTAIPDLKLSVMKPDVTATFAGGKVTFSLKIDNASAVATPNSTAQFYLSKDAKIDTTDVKPYKWTVAGLAAGKSWTGSKYVNIPAKTLNGVWYVGLRLDDTNAIKEGDEANNVMWTKIAIGPAPDLQAVSFSAFSSTMKAGNKYTLAASEKNIGDKDAGKYTTTIYLSTTSFLNKSSVKLVDLPRDGLAKNQALTYKPVITIPAATKGGTYYLVFRVDSANSVAEKLENNNYKSVKVTVTGRPDLKSALVAPSAKGWMAGSKGSVSHAETNIGTGASGAYSVRFYLSTNNVYGKGDIALTPDIKRTALKAGSSSTKGTASFVIPAITAPGKYFILHRVDSASQNAEADETNNYGAVAIEVLSKPNLKIADIALGTKGVTAGTTFKASYVLSNVGGSTAGGSLTYFYLSSDKVFGKGDILIGKSSSGSIAGGGKAQLSALLAIPAATKAGAYNVLVVADATKTVAESNELDNTTAVPLSVFTAKLPDLQVTSGALSTATTSLKPGASVSLAVSVKNAGTVSTGTYGARVFLSTDAVITPKDLAISTITVRSSITAGSTVKFTISGKIPLNTKPGTYYLGVYADPSGQITEISESNNANKGIAIKVLATPDLVADSISTTKSYYKPGETVSYALKYRNAGTAAAGGHVISLRLSTNTLISTGDKQMKSIAVKLLSAGASSSPSGSFVLPKDTAAGTYYLGMWVDQTNTVSESSEGNNIKYIKITVQSLALKPDLIPDSIKLSAASVSAGKTLSWTGSEKNIGNTSALAHSVRVYLSKSSTSVVGATTLKTISLKGLAAGSSFNIGGSYTIPSSKAPGLYYVHVKADYTNAISESSESNNTKVIAVAIAGLPNLIISSASTDKAFYKPGDSVKISWVESNTGVLTAGAHVTTVYLSSNSAITTADQFIKDVAVTSIPVKGLLAKSTTFTLPAGTAAGTWYVGLFADRKKVVAESNEFDNTKGVQISVQSILKLPDLFVSSMTTTASTYTAGATVTFNGAVKNIGSLGAGSFEVGYYLSSDATVNTADILLGTKVISSLAAGASTSLLRYIKLPTNIKAGTYYLGVYADRKFAIKEAAENNNSGKKAVKVNAVVDLKAILMTANAVFKPGAISSATVNYSNLGGATAGSHTVALYISNDSSVTTGDTLVGKVTVSSLPGLTSKSQKVNFTVPLKITTGTKYLGAIVDSANTVKETVESNNKVTKVITIQSSATKPDLIPYLFAVKGTSYKVGDTISWTGYARNIGLSTTIGMTNSVFLCPSTTFTKSCITVKSFSQSGLSANSNALMSGSWKIPTSVPNGTHYLMASVDHTAKVSEMLETNNRSTIKLTITGLADLKANTLTLSKTTFYPGDSAVAGFSEQNVGGLATTSYKTTFYLSTNTSLTTSDVQLKQLARTSLLPGLITKGISTTVVVPLGTKAGTYYIGYRSNYPSSFSETTLLNNTKTIKVTVLQAKPDLSVSSFATTAKSVVPGSAIYVSGFAKNIGSASSGSYKVGYYLSTNTTITSTDIKLGETSKASLGVGASTSLARYLTVPSNLPAGSYYVGVILDDAKTVTEVSETNNTKATTAKVTVLSRADLSVQNLRVTNQKFSSGSTVFGSFQETNWGNASAGSHTIRLYRSTNKTYDTSDALVATISATSLAAGALKTYSFSAKMPTSSLGVYYIVARLDATSAVTESNEGNNQWYVPVTNTGTSKPELGPRNVFMPGNDIVAGQSVTITGAIQNLGKANAGTNYTRIYLSTTASVTSSSTLLGTITHTSILAGKSVSFSKSVKIPSNVPNGTRYLIVRADATNTISETYGTNNDVVIRKRSTDGLPDLTVLTATVSPTSASPGATVKVTCSVKNIGLKKSGAYKIQALRSSNTNITMGDTKVGNVGTILNTNSGSGYSYNFAITVPKLASGSKFYYGCYVDSEFKVAELSESNNGKATAQFTVK